MKLFMNDDNYFLDFLNHHGKVKLSGKWVKLNPKIQRNGQERVINCFWSGISESAAVNWANNYAQQDPFAIRGTDQLP